MVRGARENNLKNIDLDIPRDKLVVFTGLSGSGKSTLAFDTIYAEGQRRYVESLSSYARQFLGQMDKPDVDMIDGLSPAISIDQKTTGRNPRSTVGTVTEIYDYLRLLWARTGVPHCPKCGKEIRQQTTDQIVDKILSLPERTKVQLLAPVVRGRKGEHQSVFEDARRSGYVRARVDGNLYELSETIPLDKNKKHNIEIIVDRLMIKKEDRRRLTDSIETALALSGGTLLALLPEEEQLFSRNYACEDCGISLEEFTPRSFSFNNPYGACPECSGLGSKMKIDEDLILPDSGKSIMDGAITASGWGNVRGDSISRMYFEALSKKYHFRLDEPVSQIGDEARKVIFYGTGGEKLTLHYEQQNGHGTLMQPFEGIVNNLERRYRETQSPAVRSEIEQCMSQCSCPACAGKRLRKEVLSVTLGGLSITDFTELSVTEELAFLDRIAPDFSETELTIAAPILKEVRTRLRFLESVGMQYLSLSRPAGTLSGGEAQRIRLATQIGSALMGVLYVLDEPSIGLHQRDNARLLKTLMDLRDLGNSLIVVEHDEDTIRAADYLVDIGPGAGVHGGRIVAQGSVEDLCACPESLTGDYLSGRRRIPVPASRRPGNGRRLLVKGAAENNLKHIDAAFPLGCFIAVTGVSGSGKSSLVNEVLYKTLAAEKMRVKTRPGRCDGVEGLEYVDKVIAIDQSPIGRSPRSNAATYTGLFNDIRELMASTRDASLRGYTPGRFSFNVKGGRWEACSGDGMLKIEMHFLPDVYVPCEACGGRRYNRETLEVRYKGKNIADILDMTVEEALDFFQNQPRFLPVLQTLSDVGLGYIRLGQSATTLSGGEAQRVKLATELSRRSTGKTVYVLDEPTTGLHMADIHRLINVLQRLADGGNTVIVIEHNLDVIKCADYLLDLGPEGGDGGGTLVFAGTPEDCARCAQSYTGQFLAPVLNREASQ